MRVLAIETSCDETAVAIIDRGKKVLVSQVLSQIDRHKVFGGVVPEIAAREHLKALDALVKSTLAESGLGWHEIDALAVTQGPGLIGALLVGVSYAKGLSLRLGKPLIPVNHVHAHVHGALIGQDAVDFPALALVVSGGHTNIYHMASPVEFKVLAQSIDDACGECFDKVAKVFGLGYPGGPAIEKAATKGDRNKVPMPKMVENKSRLVFSYSGLKTYMLNLYRREKANLEHERLADIMASFQEEAIGQLIRKLKLSVELQPEVSKVIIAGGVAANKRFRALLQGAIEKPVLFPELAFCSDNAAMIGALAQDQFELAEDKSVFESFTWDCYSRYPY